MSASRLDLLPIDFEKMMETSLLVHAMLFPLSFFFSLLFLQLSLCEVTTTHKTQKEPRRSAFSDF